MNNIKFTKTFKKGRLRKLKTVYSFNFFDTTYKIRKILINLLIIFLAYFMSKIFIGALIDTTKIGKLYSCILYIASFIIMFYALNGIVISILKIRYARLSVGYLGISDFTKKVTLDISNEEYIKLYSNHVTHKIQYYALTEAKKVGKSISIKYIKDGKKGFVLFKPDDENINGVIKLINKNWKKSINKVKDKN